MKFPQKTRFFAPLLLSLALGMELWGCTQKGVHGPELRVLTYASLGAKGGFLDSVKAEYEKVSSCALTIETTQGALQVLSYLEESKLRERTDIVMGLDELTFERVKSYFYQGEFQGLELEKRVKPWIVEHLKDRPGFVPLDYGFLSFIYRKDQFENELQVPHQLSDLTSKALQKKWITQDPRASSPGLLFLLFTDQIVEVKELKKSWLTLAPSWDASYKMFKAKEAPMVWSYLSSLAYHAQKGEAKDFGYVSFKEGLPLQLEGMALLSKVGNPLRANPCTEKWIQFILSAPVQSKLSSQQWMMPVAKAATVPPFFDAIPEVKNVARLNFNPETVDHVLEQFLKEVRRE